jgi:hypothetical protein
VSLLDFALDALFGGGIERDGCGEYTPGTVGGLLKQLTRKDRAAY